MSTIGEQWLVVKDGFCPARHLFNRHYSRHHYCDGRKPKLFVGPGEKMVLVNSSVTALFVWRKFINDSGDSGINCAVFRNESEVLSSQLIIEAEKIAFNRWGKTRLYTYVNSALVNSTNPGYCFKRAGWKFCRYTKSGLLVFEKFI